MMAEVSSNNHKKRNPSLHHPSASTMILSYAPILAGSNNYYYCKDMITPSLSISNRLDDSSIDLLPVHAISQDAILGQPIRLKNQILESHKDKVSTPVEEACL